MKKIVAVALVFIVLLSGCIWWGEKRETSTNLNSTNQTGNVIYLIYSTTCPHCEYMLDYLQKFDNITIVKTTKASKFTKVLEKFNFSWDGKVPLLFAIVENKTLVAIEGYPSKDQDVNGYFLGKEKEQEICESLKGKKVMENGEYKFCKLPNNVILGNKYAIDYLIKTCKSKGCYELKS